MTDESLLRSAFRGGRNRWELRRRPVAEAIDRDGTLLDVGCANGLLLADVVDWCRERGIAIDPYGVDLAPDLVEEARARLPGSADQLYVGDVLTWPPPRRWTWIRTELVYVDPADVGRLVGKLLDDCLEPGGSVLVCSYVSRGWPTDEQQRRLDVESALGRFGHAASRVLDGVDEDGVVRTRVAVLQHSAT